MINIFDKYDDETQDLHNSLKLAGFDYPTVVLDDNGHLVDGVISPYQYFMGEEDNLLKPRYFNQIDKPDLWEIESSNSQGSVFEYNIEKASIFYVEPKEKRLVRTVEWKDTNGKVRSVEYYNKHGRKYAHTVYDVNQISTFSTYYHVSGREAIVENHLTGSIVLTEEEGNKMFPNKIEFLHYFLKKAKLDTSKFLYNRLSLPFLMTYYYNEPGTDYLVWQENINSEIPGNMLAALSNQSRHVEVMVTEKENYEKIMNIIDEQYKNRIHLLGKIYKPLREIKYSNKILIATNSDQIEKLKELISELGDFEFNIVALTEMSDKLMNFGLYSNVRLYPNVRGNKLTELWNECCFYFDINHHGEILNAVRTAFDNNMVILGFESTLHNKKYVIDDCIYNENNYAKMIDLMKQIESNSKLVDEIITKQYEKAGSVDKDIYKQVFNNLGEE